MCRILVLVLVLMLGAYSMVPAKPVKTEGADHTLYFIYECNKLTWIMGSIGSLFVLEWEVNSPRSEDANGLIVYFLKHIQNGTGKFKSINADEARKMNLCGSGPIFEASYKGNI